MSRRRTHSFSAMPSVNLSRSVFSKPHTNKLSMSAGYLYPIDVQEVYPGDTYKTRLNYVSNVTSAFLKPVADNFFMDTYTFFVPFRLVTKWEEIQGENMRGAWAQTQEHTVPILPAGVCYEKSVGDYLGVPTGDVPGIVSVLPFRAFAMIYNEWFRDQNNIQPMSISNTADNTTTNEVWNGNQWSPNNYTGLLPKVAKLHDYFTTAVPSPQKGNSVDIKLNFSQDFAYLDVGRSVTPFSSGNIPRLDFGDNPLPDTNKYPLLMSGNGVGFDLSFGGTPNNSSSSHPVTKTNLGIDLNDLDTSTFSVNDMRLAFQTQVYLERLAIGGSRYREQLNTIWKVRSADSRVQVPEFISGKRTPMSLQRVAQTSQGNSIAPLAQLAAYSVSSGDNRYSKSFVEHGYLITVACIRQYHSYQQGIEKYLTRKTKFDFYNPIFANIGYQPIMTTELFKDADPDDIFGYNEAWADLRYRPNRICGQARTDAENSLDLWHWADYYADQPYLNGGFINETRRNIDRTLAVIDDNYDQFIVDFYFDTISYQPLPTFSMPSLTDHH